jgi:hypothetical protein
MSRSYKGIYSQESIHVTFFLKSIAINHEYKSRSSRAKLKQTIAYQTSSQEHIFHNMVNNVYRRSFFYNNAYDTNVCNLRYKMLIHHVTYAMQIARNVQRKSIHMLQKELTHPTQEIKHTPSCPHIG